MKVEKLFKWLLSFNGIIFIIFFLIISFYNRLAADDYFYLSAVKKYGIIGSTIDSYNTWNARWLPIFITETFLSFNEKLPILVIYELLALIACIMSLFFLIKVILERLTIISSIKDLLVLSAISTSALFFATIGISDTWFWLTTSPMYLLGLFSAIIGWTTILSTNEKWYHYPISIIAFVYTGCSNEPLALLDILALLTCLILPLELNKKKISLSLLFCLAAFISILLSPGIYKRQGFLPEKSLLIALRITLISTAKTLILTLPKKIIISILMSLPWLHFGNKYKSFRPEGKKMKKHIYISFAILLLTSFILIFITSYVLSDVGPARAFFPISFMYVFIQSMILFYLGTRFSLSNKFLAFIAIAQLLFLVINSIYNIQIAKNYAFAVDERMNYLETLKKRGNKNLVTLKPLPSSRYLYTAEISADTTHFTNQHLKEGLKLDFSIKRK